MSNRSTEGLPRERAALDLGEHAASVALEAWRASAVLRNACWLLLPCLAAALLALAISLRAALPAPGPITGTAIAMALLWLTWRLRRSGFGLAALLMLAIFTGHLLAPLAERALLLPHGAGMLASGILGSLFLGSAILAYALTCGRDFALLSGYLSIGIVCAALAAMAGHHHGSELTMLLAATAMVALLCGVILHLGGMLARGRERNYVMGAAGLFAALALLMPSLTASLALEDQGHNALVALLGLAVAVHALLRSLRALMHRPG